ncbi:MAG: hypothetical protein L6R36_008953 [Xanthoria steineri]|nr:MAG: hypothetical protein L6R36_008953 [Xanthoria steineri]
MSAEYILRLMEMAWLQVGRRSLYILVVYAFYASSIFSKHSLPYDIDLLLSFSAEMHHLLFPITLFLSSIFTVTAYPALGIDSLASVNESYPEIKARQDIPTIPPKPSTSGPGSFHGSQFEFLEQTGYAPAIDAMPVWMFSRTQKEFSPCAPEGGTDKTGNAPNPGTNVGASASPGEDCTDVGPQPNGPYTLANPFPTYVGASWCGNRAEWRIQFYNYYV